MIIMNSIDVQVYNTHALAHIWDMHINYITHITYAIINEYDTVNSLN